MLDHLRLAADVIYLDSAHEKQETFHELVAYWPIVRPGGLLMGDDLNWFASPRPPAPAADSEQTARSTSWLHGGAHSAATLTLTLTSTSWLHGGAHLRPLLRMIQRRHGLPPACLTCAPDAAL